MTRGNRMKFRLRDFCNGANLRRADLVRRAVHLISLRSKCFRTISEQRTGNRSQRPRKKWDIFWFSFHFSRCQNWKSRSSSILGLSLLLVKRKRLLRRLHAIRTVRQSGSGERCEVPPSTSHRFLYVAALSTTRNAWNRLKGASAFSPFTITLARLSRFSRAQNSLSLPFQTPTTQATVRHI